MRPSTVRLKIYNISIAPITVEHIENDLKAAGLLSPATQLSVIITTIFISFKTEF
jgi:hypothetical protein